MPIVNMPPSKNVVSGGRGMGTKEKFEMLFRLAELLGLCLENARVD